MEIAKTLQRSLTKQGLKFKLNTKVISAERDGDNIKVTVEDTKKGKSSEVGPFYFFFFGLFPMCESSF